MLDRARFACWVETPRTCSGQMAANVFKIMLFAAAAAAAAAPTGDFPDYDEGTLAERARAWRQLNCGWHAVP